MNRIKGYASYTQVAEGLAIKLGNTLLKKLKKIWESLCNLPDKDLAYFTEGT